MTQSPLPGADAEIARLLAEAGPGDNAAPLSVSELSNRLKRHVETGFGHVRLRGEISGWKRAASGHCYCTLKDDRAAIDGVVWKTAATTLAFAPEDGVEVVATGKLTTYPGRSKYQIVIDRMELAGQGALLALLEKLRAKLAADGVFDAATRRALPPTPRTIGVITSPTGAVIRDILHRLADRFPVHVIVWPVVVQGPGAPAAIVRALEGFGAGGPFARPDLLILARGGGSIEDLWSFNDEAVARAVKACAIPIICAVGHETDTSLADFAADLRAPTPTAAAELAVPVRAELAARIATLSARSRTCATRYHAHARDRWRALADRLPAPDSLHAPQRQRLDDLADRLRRGLAHRITDARGRVGVAGRTLRPQLLVQQRDRATASLRAAAAGNAAALDRRIGAARTELAVAGGAIRPAVMATRLARERARLGAVRLDPAILRRRVRDGEARLARVALDPAVLVRRLRGAVTALDTVTRHAAALHPLAPLSRGYALVTRSDGRVVASVDAARSAGGVTLRFADGSVPARVERPRREGYAPGDQPSLFGPGDSDGAQ